MYKKRYYGKRKYSDDKDLNIVEMFLEMVVALIILTSKLIWKVASTLFKKWEDRKKFNTRYTTSSAVFLNSEIIDKRLREEELRRMFTTKMAELKQAEAKGDVSKAEELLVECQAISKELHSLIGSKNETPKLENKDFIEASEIQKYDLKLSPLTPTEENFYDVLKVAIDNRYQIMLQVQLSSIMKVRNASYNYTNYHDFNKINKKSIDFVLYDENLKPYLAIELDDYSHSRPDRIKRDTFVDKIMDEAGLRILHIPVATNYDLDGLRSAIFQGR